MLSTYEKVIINRQKKRCRSPQGRSCISHSTTTSSPIKSASSSLCFLSLLENEEAKRRGELNHVWNPNPHSKTLALWSTNYEPCSIFICKFIRKDEEQELRIMHILSGQHKRVITSFDWSIANNNSNGEDCTNESEGRIVSCGEDCCIFVWTFEEQNKVKKNNGISPIDSYKPSSWTAKRVITQQNICMTPMTCKWDHTGNYIAIGMGGTYRTASVGLCCYDNKNNSWSSRQIGRRKIKSAVLCVAWRPSQVKPIFIASGGCDKHCRIWCSNNSQMNFEQYAEFNGEDWIVAIAWSQSGSTLAFASQKSSVFIVNCCSSGGLQHFAPAAIINMNINVMCSILFLDERRLITAGYDEHETVTLVDDEWKIQEGNISCLRRCDNNTRDETPASFVCMQMISYQPIDQDSQSSKRISTSGSEGSFHLWQTL